MLLAFTAYNPAANFYQTAATIIVTLYVAMAIQLRMLEYRPDIKIPDGPEERKGIVSVLLLFVTFPALSIVGLMSAIVALYQGRSRTLAMLTLLGLVGVIVPLVMISLNVFFRLLGQALGIPKTWRKPTMLAAGIVLFTAGTVYSGDSVHPDRSFRTPPAGWPSEAA